MLESNPQAITWLTGMVKGDKNPPQTIFPFQEIMAWKIPIYKSDKFARLSDLL